jgi:hypothetical protein
MRKALPAALLVALVSLFVASCEKGVHVGGGSSHGPIAVGAKYRFAVIDDCEYAGPGLIIISPAVPLILPTPPTCLRTSVSRIVDITWSDETPFRVVQTNVDQGAALFEVEAMTEGETEVSITIEASTGEDYTATATFTAKQATRANLVAEFCQAGRSDALVEAGTVMGYRPELYAADGQMLLGFGYLPFDFAGLPVEADETSFVRITVTFPDTRGTHVFTSSADASFRKEVRVIGVEDLTSLELEPWRDVIEMVEDDLSVAAIARAGEDIPCSESFPRRFYTDTPEACGLNKYAIPPPETTSPEIIDAFESTYVRGLTLGTTCRIHAEVTGTALSATTELPVREGWTERDVPLGAQYHAGESTGPLSFVLVGTENGGTGDDPVYTPVIARFDGTEWQMERPAIVASDTGEGVLRDVFVAGDRIIAVGDRGTIVVSQGGGPFAEVTSPTKENLFGVFGVGETEIYAVGTAGTMLREDADGWTMMDAGTSADLRDGFSLAPGVAWAGGQGGAVVALAEGTWTPLDTSMLTPPIDIQSIWAAATDNVFVAGLGGVAHFDGSSLSVVVDGNYYYHSVWGTGPDDVDVAGEYLGLDHFDGEAWTRQSLGHGYTKRVWGLGTAERYVLTAGTALDEGYVVYRYR